MSPPSRRLPEATRSAGARLTWTFYEAIKLALLGVNNMTHPSRSRVSILKTHSRNDLESIIIRVRQY
jgi:hypothetical protein